MIMLSGDGELSLENVKRFGLTSRGLKDKSIRTLKHTMIYKKKLRYMNLRVIG
jgi:hypothetical protein